MMTIERRRALILGVDHHRKGGDFRANGSIEGIGQQGAAQSLPLKIPIDSQPTEPNGWHAWVAWQLSANLGRQIRQRKAGRCQRVIAGNPAFGIQCDKASRYPASAILGNLLPEIAVQWFRTAAK